MSESHPKPKVPPESERMPVIGSAAVPGLPGSGPGGSPDGPLAQLLPGAVSPAGAGRA